MTKLCLGTVQFGMNYGINNQIGRQPTWEESFEMLDYALEHGIDILDTARAYGEAELVLGKYFEQDVKRKNVKIISKLRPNCIETSDIVGTIEEELISSLNRMKIDFLDGYLLHTPEYILNSKIVDAMTQMKIKGLVKNIGVSIYDMKHGFDAINTGKIDYIQFPYNVFDQRGSQTEFIKQAKQAGIVIYARSAFLQGLFMLEPDNVPERVGKSRLYLKKFQSLLEKYNINRIDALLGFIKKETEIDYLVFGVEKLQQLQEDIDRFAQLQVPEQFYNEIECCFGNVEQSIIIPSLWSDGKKAK